MDTRSALETITADAASGEMVFPTHSAIALRAQRMIDDPDCSTDALGKLISAEPVLSARVLGLANSTAYNPGGRAVTDVKNAVTRLGLSALRAMVASVIVRQMRELPSSEAHRTLAETLWQHTASVAALARVIAKRVTHQNPDAAFLAGIVHELGAFYLIARAAAFPGLLDGDFEYWHEAGEAMVGRAVLRALNLPPHIVEALDVRWSGFLALPPSSLGDTLLLAEELSPVESPLDALADMSRRGMSVELEMLIDDATLTDILAESAGEVASLSAALNT